ncbi:MAG: hypothetical protein Q8K55_07415 [Gemmatimonadaceae bacterium]|nr:hypothetical protein [Gemmatimonadaceae bacterium]
MPHSGQRAALRCCLTAAALMAACRATPSVTVAPVAGPAPAARACPAPTLRRVPWVLVGDSSGIVIALPPGFQERPSGGAYRSFASMEGYRPYMSFGVIRGTLGLAGYRRAYQSELMPDYSECTDTVNGYAVSIQAWRTPNGVFRNSQRSDRYDVYAIWEVGPGAYAYLSGGTDHQPTQTLMLAAIRAWRMSKR